MTKPGLYGLTKYSKLGGLVRLRTPDPLVLEIGCRDGAGREYMKLAPDRYWGLSSSQYYRACTPGTLIARGAIGKGEYQDLPEDPFDAIICHTLPLKGIVNRQQQNFDKIVWYTTELMSPDGLVIFWHVQNKKGYDERVFHKYFSEVSFFVCKFNHLTIITVCSGPKEIA